MEKFSGPLSRRYGTALFETLNSHFAKNKDEFAKASEAIRLFSSNIDKKTVQIFKNQSFSFVQKQALLTDLLKIGFQCETISKSLHDCLFNFLLLVIKNKRFSLIHPIFDFYLKQADEYLNIIRANIISARSMSKNVVEKFESTISHSLQKKVVFSNFIDESLQCGFLIKIGSVNVDASLKSFLTKLKESVR